MRSNLNLRKVESEDIDLLFEWANESQCRKNSFRSERIDYNEHKRWFVSKLNDINCNMYLLVSNDDYIGQVRVEKDGDTGLVSYSINKNYRGKGYGYDILSILEEEIKRMGEIKYLVGKVKHDNQASHKIFMKLGYIPEENEDYILYKKIISMN
ncbi:GNAT family N-acetyltransferase [Lachnotalea glycerini]|uniref:N-acetyltransferase n=1 Tax=Lachnotalea glycerini TaxID=1763509 RepID=A0A371J3K3_9FIRM|nr:GNAT family N-acetyltransferase [Lachnotalea glycerini]RDY27370.1 N-acetyltransferase [Lachnotalea glycerini]